MARRTRLGTDFVGWDSSAIQLRNPSGTQKDSVACSLNSVLFPGTSQGLESASQGVVWCHKSTGGKAGSEAGVSSSPMGTTLPSKLPRSTRRTSYPSRLSRDVVLQVEHSQYYSAENQFERFRRVLELISRFEFEFRRCDFFLNDSNFWCVQRSITHDVAVHVPVLWPVCAHTIPFRMLWCP